MFFKIVKKAKKLRGLGFSMHENRALIMMAWKKGRGDVALETVTLVWFGWVCGCIIF